MNNKKRTSSLDRSSTSKSFKMDYTVPTKNTFSALATTSPKVKATIPKPAPITITDRTINVSTLFKAFVTFPYRLKIVSVGTKVYVDKEGDFKVLIASLRKKNIEFFTHPFGESKTFKLILAGLPEIPTNEITDCLKTHNNVTVDKITMLNTTGSFKRYLMQFNPKENTRADVMNVRIIMNHVIKWHSAKNNRRGPSQCLKCAMYGHGISSCDRKPVCTLCGDGHETKDCEFGKTNNSEQCIFKCFNCKENKLPFNHKATDPSCPSRLKYIEIRAAANTKKVRPAQQYQHTASNFPPLHTTRAAPIPPPLTHSFASAAKTRTQQYATHNAQRDEGNDLLSFSEISSILFNCIGELEKCTNKYDQLRVIANLLSNVCK